MSTNSITLLGCDCKQLGLIIQSTVFFILLHVFVFILVHFDCQNSRLLCSNIPVTMVTIFSQVLSGYQSETSNNISLINGSNFESCNNIVNKH